MELMHWHDSFSVGVRVIDDQHRQLFSLINELIVAVDSRQQDSVLERIQGSLLSYAQLHFRTEEELLKIHSRFASHCAIHRQFADRIGVIATDSGANTSAVAVRLLEFLIDWLQNHILKTDMTFFSELGYRPRETKDDIAERLHLLTSRVKVLVVDDSPVQRLLLKRTLEKAGFEVLEAQNGAEALRQFDATYDLHLVITDLSMPEMDGYELIRALRDNQMLSVYIIVVTVSSDREALTRSFELGANDFLSKPIFDQELHLRLRNGMQLLRLESQDELIFSLAKLADCRSPETGKHLERVQLFIRLLGRQLIASKPDLGMTESIATEIARVSPLHDIGKVAIADYILNKPGKLTPEEFAVMKDHARVGGDLIGSILRKKPSRSLRLAYELTMYHHEKWDGSGYPLGLIGTDIPLAARIMAVADVYDAVTSNRVYKKPFSREEARKVMVNGAGNHFDPDLVEAFEAQEARFHQLREELED